MAEEARREEIRAALEDAAMEMPLDLLAERYGAAVLWYVATLGDFSRFYQGNPEGMRVLMNTNKLPPIVRCDLWR